jgi:hypothetical protein
VDAERCWFEECRGKGLTRPLLAHVAGLPSKARLCEVHVAEVAAHPRDMASRVREPIRPRTP